MTSTCQYCNKAFSGERRTKKYCNDNCRQMAYLSRKGFSVDGMDSVKPITEATRVKYANDVDGHVKYDTSVKPDVKPEPMDIARLLEKLSERIEAKITQAVDTLRRELTVKPELKNDTPAVKLCSPCNVDGFMLTRTAIGEIEEPGLCNEPEEEEDETIYIDEPEDQEPEDDTVTTELEAANRRIKELEKNLLEAREHLLQKITLDAEKELAGKDEEQPEDPEPTEQEEEAEEQEEEKPAPQPDKFQQGTVPKLHMHIERMLEKGQHGHVFDNPMIHWPLNDVKNILWVNVRLRCLLASLVKMSNFAHVDKESFTLLANGFISLYNSPAFQSLPANYPYTNLFIELTDWLRESAAKHNAREDVKVILTVRRKALIIAICYELAENTEIVKFSELKFEPLQGEKKAQAPAWRRTDEETRRKRRHEIEQWKQHKKAA